MRPFGLGAAAALTLATAAVLATPDHGFTDIDGRTPNPLRLEEA